MAYATSTYVALALFAAGTAAQQNQQSKARKHQENAEDAQKAAQEAADAEMRRQRVREERVKRAQILQFATGTGVAGSSGESGAVSSLGTQLGSSVAFQTGQQESTNVVGSEAQASANYTNRANTYGQVANLSLSAFTQTDDFKSIFKE